MFLRKKTTLTAKHRRFRFRGRGALASTAGVFALISPLQWVLAAPPTDAASVAGIRYSDEELLALKRTADRDFDHWYPRCDRDPSRARDSAETVRAVQELQSAGLSQARFVTHYPMAPRDQARLVLEKVVPAFERAFDCAPSPEARYLLRWALAAINDQLQRLGDDTGSDWSDVLREIADLDQKRTTILAKLLQATPAVLDPVPPEPEPPAQGYDTWRGRLSLRLEVGSGWVLDEPITFATHLGAGIRLFGDRSRLHALSLAVDYSFYGDAGNISKFQMHSIVLRIEHSLRLHPKWFAIQTAFESGLGTIYGDDSAAVVFGPALGLCTWGEAFCVRGRVRGGSNWVGRGRDHGGPTSVGILLGLDFLRLVDNRRAGGQGAAADAT